MHVVDKPEDGTRPSCRSLGDEASPVEASGEMRLLDERSSVGAGKSVEGAAAAVVRQAESQAGGRESAQRDWRGRRQQLIKL